MDKVSDMRISYLCASHFVKLRNPTLSGGGVVYGIEAGNGIKNGSGPDPRALLDLIRSSRPIALAEPSIKGHEVRMYLPQR